MCFFNDTATTEIYTLSLHDALPIYGCGWLLRGPPPRERRWSLGPREPAAPSRGLLEVFLKSPRRHPRRGRLDRKSTRLNSSYANISYAVFCLKKKNTHQTSSLYNIS